jgi:DUF177 domain-containing protein
VLITLAELELHRIEVSKTYDSGVLDFRSAEFRQSAPLRVDAVAELAGAEIRLRGHLGTRLTVTCDRCLATFDFPVDRDFDLFYRPNETIARAEEIEVPKEELGIGFYSGEGIDLADAITEQVILSVPMKLVCRPDCRGLCPVCGADHNRVECQCAPPCKESPFVRLK